MGKSWKDSMKTDKWESKQSKPKGKKQKTKQRDYTSKYKNFFNDSE